MRTAIFASAIFVALAASAFAKTSMLPQGWTAEKRANEEAPLVYRSPDGTGVLSLLATPNDGRTRSFLATTGEGERITYKRITPRFVAVSGYKAGRIFYRKSNLACGGTRWHHIAFDYPAEDKRKMDAMVTRLAHGMNRFDNHCRGSDTKTSGGIMRKAR